ncbi:type 1 glutamine amidotransferase [Candidatus Woesearchaeota archaeon]|nr:type 1 glutamine amidotransferase [Candidatus Woesearchaeota archaeon]
MQFKVFNSRRTSHFPDPRDYLAVIVLGGPQSANDSSMRRELDFIDEALKSEIPYFGICLGAQALVKAAGGEVYKAPFKEIGCRDSGGNYFQVELTEEGKLDEIAEGVSNPFKVFQLHGDTLKLDKGVILLGKGHGHLQIPNQFVKVGKNAYGLQPHVELVNHIFDRWLKGSKDLQSLVADELRNDYSSVRAEYQRNCRALINNFLKIAGVGTS